MKRTTTWAVMALIAGLTLTACAPPELDDKPAAVAPSEASPDKAIEESPAPEPEPEPAKQGTRENPFPKGTPVGTDEVTLALGEVTWNANDIVSGENQFNEPAPEGSTYAILPVTITNVSKADAVQPGYAFSIAFVADDGRSFEQSYQVIPEDLSNVDDLYAGGVGSGNVLFALPNEVSASGVWAIEETFGFGDPVFIAAH
jgi:hypothetical protein